MKHNCTLATCIKGDKVTLTAVNNKELSLQLYCMGCVPGESIQVERVALLGDPIIISIENNFISLRKEDAIEMMVKK